LSEDIKIKINEIKKDNLLSIINDKVMAFRIYWLKSILIFDVYRKKIKILLISNNANINY